MSDVDDETPATPAADMGEIATIQGGRDITRGFIPWNLLEPQDRILATRGYDYRLYEFVLGDDQVKSCLQQRQRAIVARPWEVKPGGTSALDKKAAESLAAQLQAIPWDIKTEKMLFGVFYGFSIAECLFARDGREIVLDSTRDGMRVRNRRRFKFDINQQPKLVTFEKPLGEELPPRKFWTFNTGADNDDDPYGLGLAYWLYWPVWFKRNDLKFWLQFADKYGQPTPKATYPRGATEDQKQEALAIASAIARDAAVAVPEGMLVELIEAARSGTGDYDALYDRMDSAIAKVTLSQTMTSDVKAAGLGSGQANVHDDVKDEVVISDNNLICGSFNAGPGKWLTEWNYPGAKTPIVTRKLEDEPDLAAIATRDKTIYDMGFEPTEEYIRDTYGEGWVKRATPTPVPGQLPGGFGGPASFALPAQSGGPLVNAWADRVGDIAAPTIAAMVDQVRALGADCGSIEELRDRLIELYPSLNPNLLARVMQQALTASNLAGHYEAMQ